MFTRTSYIGLSLLTAASLSACESVESQDIKTHAIHANLKVEAKGDGKSAVTAILQVGNALGTYVKLSDGDKLIARSQQVELALSGHTDLLDATEYNGSFDGDASSKPFQISFERSSDRSAPNSHGVLPAPFRLQQPLSGTTFSRHTQQIVITWTSQSTQPMSITASGDCIETYREKSEPGLTRFVIPAGALKASRDSAIVTCPVALEIRRENLGHVDAAYGEGGRFSLSQVRSLSMISTP